MLCLLCILMILNSANCSVKGLCTLFMFLKKIFPLMLCVRFLLGGITNGICNYNGIYSLLNYYLHAPLPTIEVLVATMSTFDRYDTVKAYSAPRELLQD